MSRQLNVGDIIILDEKKHAVIFRSESRAKVTRHFSTIKWREDENGKISFIADEIESISPNSEVPIVKRLGRQGLVNYLEGKEYGQKTESTAENTDKTMSKKNKSEKADKAEKPAKNKKAKKEAGTPRAGKLGGYEGHSITSVIRSCGKFGWNSAEVAAFCDKIGIPVRPGTINIQLGRGRKGGEGADFKLSGLSKAELDKVKPKGLADAKPAKKAEAGKKADKKKAKKGKSAKSGDSAPKKKKSRPGDKAKEQIERLSQQVAADDEPEESPERAAEDAEGEGEEAAE